MQSQITVCIFVDGQDPNKPMSSTYPHVALSMPWDEEASLQELWSSLLAPALRAFGYGDCRGDLKRLQEGEE